jgi:hypothetical protein
MKYFLIVYIICNSFIFSIGQQFVEEFENNKNDWYINYQKIFHKNLHTEV